MDRLVRIPDDLQDENILIFLPGKLLFQITWLHLTNEWDKDGLKICIW